MTVLDKTGHTTIAWDREDSEWMLPEIQARMDAGEVFWIVKRDPLREEQLRSISEIGDNRHIIIRGDAGRRLLSQSRLHAVREDDDDDGDIEVERPARTAREAAENDTVTHRPHAGG